MASVFLRPRTKTIKAMLSSMFPVSQDFLTEVSWLSFSAGVRLLRRAGKKKKKKKKCLRLILPVLSIWKARPVGASMWIQRWGDRGRRCILEGATAEDEGASPSWQKLQKHSDMEGPAPSPRQHPRKWRAAPSSRPSCHKANRLVNSLCL